MSSTTTNATPTRPRNQPLAPVDPTQPNPIYLLWRASKPIPEPKLKMTLEEYRAIPAEEFKGTRKIEKTEYKIVYSLVEARPSLWNFKYVRAPFLQWEELVVDFIVRTGVLVTVEQLRAIWTKGKNNLRNKLRASIVDHMHNESETEDFLYKWQLYPYMRFYRTILREYEGEQRKRVGGLDFNREVLEDTAAFDDEIQIIDVVQGVNPIGGLGIKAEFQELVVSVSPSDTSPSSSAQSNPPSIPTRPTSTDSARKHKNSDFLCSMESPKKPRIHHGISEDDVASLPLTSPIGGEVVESVPLELVWPQQLAHNNHPPMAYEAFDRSLEASMSVADNLLNSAEEGNRSMAEFMFAAFAGAAREYDGFSSLTNAFKLMRETDRIVREMRE